MVLKVVGRDGRTVLGERPDLYDTPVLRDGDLQLDDLIGRD